MSNDYFGFTSASYDSIMDTTPGVPLFLFWRFVGESSLAVGISIIIIQTQWKGSFVNPALISLTKQPICRLPSALLSVHMQIEWTNFRIRTHSLVKVCGALAPQHGLPFPLLTGPRGSRPLKELEQFPKREHQS
jgi:hypothetical protein